MLTAIRERATGWIAWVIVIILVIPFALWGVSSYFEGGIEVSVASVNGEDISTYTYQEDLSLQTRALSQRLGGNFDPELLNTLGIRQRVLDNLIDNRLLNQYADENGFRISDEQLAQLIQNEASFQIDGKFNLNQYQTILASNRFTPQSFEQYQRVNETVNQLSAGISETAFATEYDKQKLIALQDQRRTASYVVIGSDQLEAAGIEIDELKPEEKEISEYYDRNQERYLNQARIQVNYIELSAEALLGLAKPTEEEVALLYEETKGRYRTAESRRASHILVAVNATEDEDGKQEKLKLAEDLLERINQGEDFAALAEEFSEDPGSSGNGGDLGVVARDQMVKPFEDAVFSMEPGQTTGPVETQFGYHIIQLTELQEGEQQTLEDVRESVTEEAATIQAENLFADLAESFKNLVFEDPENLTTTADELDLPIQTSDWFTANAGTGVAQDSQVRTAAFSVDVLTDNLVSPAIEIGFDKLIAVQKLEYEPENFKELEEVKQQIIDTIEQEKIQAKILELGSDYLAELSAESKTKTQWETFVRSKELKIEPLAEKKQDIAPNLALLGDSVFSTVAPEEGTIVSGGVALSNGDYALFALEAVIPGDPVSVDEAVSSNLQARLESRDGSEMYAQFRAMLRDNAEVVIYHDQL